MRRFLLPFVALALLTACGDDGPDIDPDADEERIEDAILTLDDLPDGFVEADVDDDDDENECNEDVLGIDPDELDDNETATAGPVQFDDDVNGISVRAELTAFRETDLPEQVLDGLGDDEYLDCVADNFEDEFEGGTFDGIEEVDTPVDGGAGAAIFVTIDGPDGAVEIESQQHAALEGRFGVTLQVTALAGELDDDLVEDLLETMMERLEED